MVMVMVEMTVIVTVTVNVDVDVVPSNASSTLDFLKSTSWVQLGVHRWNLV